MLSRRDTHCCPETHPCFLEGSLLTLSSCLPPRSLLFFQHAQPGNSAPHDYAMRVLISHTYPSRTYISYRLMVQDSHIHTNDHTRPHSERLECGVKWRVHLWSRALCKESVIAAMPIGGRGAHTNSQRGVHTNSHPCSNKAPTNRGTLDLRNSPTSRSRYKENDDGMALGISAALLLQAHALSHRHTHAPHTRTCVVISRKRRTFFFLCSNNLLYDIPVTLKSISLSHASLVK